ncbi:MAG: NADH-quinone oxidoreductase subunit NuoN [Candidatus Methylophosphatis roskildensis]
MNFVMPDFIPAAAEIFILAMACVVLLADLFFGKTNRWLTYFLTQASLVGAAAISAWLILNHGGDIMLTFGNMFIRDLMADFLKLVVYLAVALVVLYGRGYNALRGLDRGEYYLLVLFATLGMMVMISSNHFLTMYLGLELLSLSLYTMVALDRESARSTEAAMKYFVLGALASGLLLYGMSMIYGATGTLEISGVAGALHNHMALTPVLTFGLVFLVAGLAFKLGVVPFHMWIPDVYQGAPTAVTLMIGSAPKLAAFAMAIRLLVFGLFDMATHWQPMLIFLAVLSIALGNIAAIAQTNLKRMLGYSAISHMGYMLLGLLAGIGVDGSNHGANAYSSAMFYAIVYVLTSLASFGMIILLSRAGFESEDLDDFKGLNKRSPWFAAMMMIVMFSMAGIPFFIGFFAKFWVLQAVVHAGHVWLAVFAVMMSLIGAYYYLRVVKLMYFDEPAEDAPIAAAPDMRFILSVNSLAIAVLGLMPGQLMSLCAYVLTGGQ